MPVEIRELVLRARITEDAPPAAPDTPPRDELPLDDLIATIDRRIQAALRQRSDR